MLSDGLKEVDDVFIQLTRNRNNYLDLVNPGGANPDAFDWIDGGRIGSVEDVFQRFMNVLTDMPTSDRLSPERRVLVAIESMDDLLLKLILMVSNTSLRNVLLSTPRLVSLVHSRLRYKR